MGPNDCLAFEERPWHNFIMYNSSGIPIRQCLAYTMTDAVRTFATQTIHESDIKVVDVGVVEIRKDQVFILADPTIGST